MDLVGAAAVWACYPRPAERRAELLDDFTEDIADTEKGKGGGYGIVLNQLD
jgi:hypothetical protein